MTETATAAANPVADSFLACLERSKHVASPFDFWLLEKPLPDEDAAAIAEAVSRPNMRFVEVKRPEQVDLQALHRIRDQMVCNRTRLICQMRAFCLEYGVAIRQGPAFSNWTYPVSSPRRPTI